MIDVRGAGGEEDRDLNERDRPVPRIDMGGVKNGYAWVPQPDITAAELAEAMVLLHLAPMVLARIVPPMAVDACCETMTAGAKRHFLVKSNSPIVLARG